MDDGRFRIGTAERLSSDVNSRWRLGLSIGDWVRLLLLLSHVGGRLGRRRAHIGGLAPLPRRFIGSAMARSFRARALVLLDGGHFEDGPRQVGGRWDGRAWCE
jgi:hypothetical protein